MYGRVVRGYVGATFFVFAFLAVLCNYLVAFFVSGVSVVLVADSALLCCFLFFATFFVLAFLALLCNYLVAFFVSGVSVVLVADSPLLCCFCSIVRGHWPMLLVVSGRGCGGPRRFAIGLFLFFGLFLPPFGATLFPLHCATPPPFCRAPLLLGRFLFSSFLFCRVWPLFVFFFCLP